MRTRILNVNEDVVPKPVNQSSKYSIFSFLISTILVMPASCIISFIKIFSEIYEFLFLSTSFQQFLNDEPFFFFHRHLSYSSLDIEQQLIFIPNNVINSRTLQRMNIVNTNLFFAILISRRTNNK